MVPTIETDEREREREFRSELRGRENELTYYWLQKIHG